MMFLTLPNCMKMGRLHPSAVSNFDMILQMVSNRIVLSVLAAAALAMAGLTVHFRADQRRLAAQNEKLLIQVRDLEARLDMPSEVRPHPTALLDNVSDTTALSFFWFGDIDSHFRDPINFYVASEDDSRLHTVAIRDSNRQVNVFVSAAEMISILDRLKALGLDWVDMRGREDFKDTFHRKASDMLDITLVSSGNTAKTHIRIARMCDELSRLDSVMPTPRILWQFQTFRWDNGCYVHGYNNAAKPPQ